MLPPAWQVVLASIAQPDSDYGKEAKGEGRGQTCRPAGATSANPRQLAPPADAPRTSLLRAQCLMMCAACWKAVSQRAP